MGDYVIIFLIRDVYLLVYTGFMVIDFQSKSYTIYPNRDSIDASFICACLSFDLCPDWQKCINFHAPVANAPILVESNNKLLDTTNTFQIVYYNNLRFIFFLVLRQMQQI
jgi:hypothetical protein